LDLFYFNERKWYERIIDAARITSPADMGAATGGSVGLAAMLLYPIGFFIVIIGCALSSIIENTITPVTVVLTKSDVLPNML
jgi:hypothetical protein